jgi:hypothetical protein
MGPLPTGIGCSAFPARRVNHHQEASSMSDTLRATVDLLDGMAFRATSGTGHVVVMDAAPEAGGGDSGG